MRSTKTKGKINRSLVKKILIWAVIAVVILFLLFGTFLRVQRNVQDYKYKSILSEALSESNAFLCKEYKDPTSCVVLVGRKMNNISVCDNFYDDSYSKEDADLIPISVSACKAAILRDMSLCLDNFESVCLWVMNNADEEALNE